MAQRVISGDRYEEVVVRSAPGSPLPVTIEGADVTINAEIGSTVEISNDTGNPVPVNGTVKTLAGLEIPAHDYVSISPGAAPANSTQTVTYKTGGASGTTVGILTLTYSSGELVSVAKS